MLVPRIRGRVGVVEEPVELAGKWAFTVWLAYMGEGEGHEIGTYGPFDTEQQAKEELNKMVRHACETLEKEVTGVTSGMYLDLKTNQIMPWDKQ